MIKCKGIYNRLDLTMCLLLDMDLALYGTPDYKDKKIETEKAKTYNTPFLSLKRPDFKYVIFKIVEVSPRNPPAKQHSRFGPIPPNVGRIGCAA